ncbi:MAG: outer membrane protein [Geminicoccaceae bacterium]
MLRKLSIALLGVVLWPVSTMAQNAQNLTSNLYLQGAVGQSTFWDVEVDGSDDAEFDFLAFFISGAVGYRVSPTLRTEAEWLFEQADIDDSSAEAEVIRLTLSGYLDLASTNMMGFSNLTPYVGGGGGFALVEVGDSDETELTFHGEAGISVPITGQIEFVPAIRFEYVFLDEDEFNADSDLWITQLRAGLRYNF